MDILNIRRIARKDAEVDEARHILSKAIENHQSGKYKLSERGFQMVCGMSVALQWIHGEDKAMNGELNTLAAIMNGAKMRREGDL